MQPSSDKQGVAGKKISCAIILFTLVILFTGSCNAERRLIKRLVKTQDSISICLIAPSYLLKQNLKTWEIKGYDSIPENKRDSVAYYNSKFLQYVNDSLFLGQYTHMVTEELGKYGLHVYTQDSMDAFLASGGSLYMFNIAQITLEEYMEPFKKSIEFDTTRYNWEIWCNAMAMNIWIEASVLNVPDKKMKVLYGNMYVRDNVKGRFSGDPFSGSIRYLYNIDSIDVNSAYRLAGKAAKLHASYLFDFIMNDRLERKTGKAIAPEDYLHYDAEKRKFRKAGDFRFSEIQ